MLRLIEKTLNAWTELSRRGGWFVILAFLLATGGAAYIAATHLKVNTDTSAMLDPDLDFQKRSIELRDAFPQIRSDIIVIVKSQTLDEADAFAAALRQRLLSRKDIFLSVFSPAEEPFFLKNGLLFLDESELEARLTQLSKAAGLIEILVKSPTADTLFATLADNDALAERSDLGKETLRDIYAELANVIEASLQGERRPFSWMGALDTGDPPANGHMRLIYVTPVLDFSRLQPAKPAVTALRDEIAALAPDYGARIETYITGDPALRAEELESVTTGIGLSLLISFVLVAALLLFAFRSAFLAVLTLTGLIITLVLTSAFAALTVGELNLVSVAFTVLLIGLGLDFAIHLLLHVQERRAGGQNTRHALRGAVHEVGPAIAIAAPTTALAFLSFVPTQFDGIAQLGIIAGAGVIIAFLVSVTFLPAALGALSLPVPRQSSGAIRQGFAYIEKVSGPVAVATIVLGLGAVILLPDARFDADPMALRNAETQSVKGFNLLFDDEETIPYRLTRLAADQASAKETAERAKKIPTVRGVRSLPDFVPEDQEAKLELIEFAAGSLAFALAATPGEARAEQSTIGAQKLVVRLSEAYEDATAGERLARQLEVALSRNDPAILARIESNIFAYWPQLVARLRLQLQADYVDLDDLPTGLANRYVSANGKWRVDFLPAEDVREREALKRFVDTVEEEFPDLAGGASQTLKAGEIISASMLQATSLALCVIALFLWLLLRRVSTVLLILFPLALAALLTNATGVLLNIPFNYANVIVLPLLIGIGVDSGIHLVLRQRQVREGENVFGTSTPRAVMFSALTTVASFGSLMLSPHRGTASMGELLSIAVAFTLICTLVVLPAAFRYGEGRALRA